MQTQQAVKEENDCKMANSFLRYQQDYFEPEFFLNIRNSLFENSDISMSSLSAQKFQNISNNCQTIQKQTPNTFTDMFEEELERMLKGDDLIQLVNKHSQNDISPGFR